MDALERAHILDEARETIERVERQQAEWAQRDQRSTLGDWNEKAPRSVNSKVRRYSEQALKAAIHAELLEFADLIGEEAGQQEKRILTSMTSEIKRLQDEVDALRKEIEILCTAKNVAALRSNVA